MNEKPFDIQRRVVAHKTVESWDTIPHAGIIIDLDVTGILAFADRLRKSPAFSGIRLTINSIMLKVIAESIKASPDINSELIYHKRANTGRMRYLDSIDIAIPLLSSCNRMITPVLRNVGRQSLRDVCISMDTLKKRANNTNIDLLLLEAGLKDTWERLRRGHLLPVLRRLYANFLGSGRLCLPSKVEQRVYNAIPATERLTADDLMGASTLVSNIGSVTPGLNCYGALLDIIPPQITAMLLGSVQKRPTVIEDETGNESIEIRKIMPITFYFDHRALDFEHISGFLERLQHLSVYPDDLLVD